MHRTGRASPRVWPADVSLAVALTAAVLLISRLAAQGQVPSRQPLDEIAYAIIIVMGAALAGRRVWPLATLAVVATATAGYLAFQYPYGPVFALTAVAAYSAAVCTPMPRSGVACGVALVVVLAGHAPEITWQSVLTDAPSMALGGVGVVVAPWAIGTVVRLHRESAERTRVEDARRHAYEERIRVVQEVHDVVGHGLSAINLQAGVALHVLDTQPEQARPALESIKQTSKDALDELRGTLAVFRQPDTQERSPSPGLVQLDDLVTRMDRAGLPVETTVTGQDRRLPAAVDLAAYRIVQEALTNVLRHAGDATATVRVAYRSGAVDIEVADNGRARQSDAGQHGGFGLVGMRERAAAVGGVAEAGPRPEGGFLVQAHLPFTGDGR